MSEEKIVGSTEPVEPQSEPVETKVDKAAYDNVTKDMHKYKAKLAEIEKEKQALLEEKKIAARKSMEENQQFKELHEMSKAEAEQLRRQLEGQSKRFVDTAKINALLQEVGGVLKSEYAEKFKLDNVELNENGDIDSDSVRAEAARFRANYSELLKKPEVKQMIASTAPTTKNIPVPSDKPFADLSPKEQEALRKQAMDEFRKRKS